jgi:hypothetical protein
VWEPDGPSTRLARGRGAGQSLGWDDSSTGRLCPTLPCTATAPPAHPLSPSLRISGSGQQRQLLHSLSRGAYRESQASYASAILASPRLRHCWEGVVPRRSNGVGPLPIVSLPMLSALCSVPLEVPVMVSGSFVPAFLHKRNTHAPLAGLAAEPPGWSRCISPSPGSGVACTPSMPCCNTSLGG